MLSAGPRSLLVKGIVPVLARAAFAGGPAPTAGLLNCPSLPSHAILYPSEGVITMGAGGAGAVAKEFTSISSISSEPLETLMRMPVAASGAPPAAISYRCRRYGVKEGATALT